MKKIAVFFVFLFWFAPGAETPVGKWNFEEAPTGKVQGEIAAVPGIFGKGLSFGGTGSVEVQIPPTPGDKVTLEAWVKLDTLEQEWSGILTRFGKGGIGYGLMFRNAGNGFRFVVTLDAKTSVMVQTEKEKIVPGVWYHLAGVYDGKNLTLYLNGSPTAKSGALALPEMDAPVFLGKMGSWAKESLKGSVDEAAVYPAALSGSEVAAKYGRYVKTGGEVKYVACDFEDVGTWRPIVSEGSKGKWFAGHIFLSSTKKEKHKGNYGGVLRYAFTEPSGPYRFSFRRAKIMENKVQSLKSISFHANPKNYPCEIAFEIMDGKGKKVTTAGIPLEKNVWKEYTIPFDEANAKGSGALQGPFCIHLVQMRGREAGEGEIFLDDLTLTGEVLDPKKRVAVDAIYQGIGYRPGENVVLDYRVRNYSSKDEVVEIALAIDDFYGKAVAAKKNPVSVKAHGEVVSRFSFPAMETGHYRVNLNVSGGVSYSIEDMFGVFQPNGKRLNRNSSFFGVEDQEMWKGEEENLLHKEWMVGLGVDLERFGVTGGRFEFEKGNVSGSDGFTPMLKELAKHNIDSFVCYSIVPDFAGKGYKKPPSDLAAFQDHAERLGAYLSAFPNVKYIEFWNEPDVEFFDGTTEEYLSALKSFYTGVKKAAPQIKITTGGVTVKHPREKKDFTRDMYLKGKGFYDLAAFHAHGALENYQELNGMVEGYLREAKNPVPICNTESGDRSAYDYAGYRAQAATLIKKISYAKSRPATEFYSWFTLKDYWDMDPGADDSFGLVNSDNRVKPSFVAYNELIRQLANTRPDGEASLDARLTAYQFIRDDGTAVHVLWPKTANANVTFALSAVAPVTRTDMFGKSETLTPEGGKIFASVSGYPIYLSVAGGGRLAAAKGDTSFFDCPSSVGASPGEKINFQALVKNVWKGPAQVSLKFFNDRGGELSAQSFSLDPGASKKVPLSLDVPVNEKLGAKNYYFTLNAPEAGIQNMFLPLSVIATYQAHFLANGVSVEANLLPKARPIVMENSEAVRELAFDPTIPKWSGPADLSLKAGAAHDGKNIYLAFDVADDKQVQTFGGPDIWKGDSVQVAFYTADGKQSEFTMALTSGGPLGWCHLSFDKKNNGKWDVPLSIRRSETRTFYEVVIPMEKLGLSTAKESSLFRFSFLVNDDDGRGRVRILEWFGGIGSGSKNPDQYGYGQLEVR